LLTPARNISIAESNLQANMVPGEVNHIDVDALKVPGYHKTEKKQTEIPQKTNYDLVIVAIV